MPTKTLPLITVPDHILKPILILLIIASLFLIDMDETHACTCMPISPSEAFDGASSVFSGKAVATHDLYSPTTSQYLSEPIGLMYLIPLNDYSPSHIQFIYEFEVDTIWKGPNYGYIYVVSSFACGRSFTLGERYLVYAGSGMTTGQCDGSHLIGPAIAPEVLETLGAGQPPTAGTRAPRPLPGWHSKDEMLEILFDSLYRVLADRERESRAPTPTPSPVPTEEPTPQPATVGETTDAPGWLLPAVAGVAGVLAGVLATSLTLRRQDGA